MWSVLRHRSIAANGIIKRSISQGSGVKENIKKRIDLESVSKDLALVNGKGQVKTATSTTVHATTTVNATYENGTMSWNEFFLFRKRFLLFKRFAGGVPALFAFFTAEGALLSLPIFDPTAPIAGIDPLVMVGLGTALGSLASFTAGSALIGQAWRLFNPLKARLFDSKQRDFYARITAFRANVPPNPTQLNFSFDFYGEKVASVRDYRKWLKRQRQMISERKFK